jgi:hypothetical protein
MLISPFGSHDINAVTTVSCTLVPAGFGSFLNSTVISLSKAFAMLYHSIVKLQKWGDTEYYTRDLLVLAHLAGRLELGIMNDAWNVSRSVKVVGLRPCPSSDIVSTARPPPDWPREEGDEHDMCREVPGHTKRKWLIVIHLSRPIRMNGRVLIRWNSY